MNIKTHWCGCETRKDNKGIIRIINLCNIHKINNKFVWIILQHDT